MSEFLGYLEAILLNDQNPDFTDESDGIKIEARSLQVVINTKVVKAICLEIRSDT